MVFSLRGFSTEHTTFWNYSIPYMFDYTPGLEMQPDISREIANSGHISIHIELGSANDQEMLVDVC